MDLPLRLRLAAGFLACSAAAVAVDLWLRFWVLPVHGADSPTGIRLFNEAVRFWGRLLFRTARWATRLELSVAGRVPTEGRYIVVANHSSSLDIPLLITILSPLNLKFVAMERLRRWRPAISLVVRHGGFVLVGKRRPGQDLANLQRFGADLARTDGSAVIFPAGRLARGDPAPPFQFGGVEAVRRGSRLPLLPVAIAGLERAPSIGSYGRLARAQVRVRIFDPIPCEAADEDPAAVYGRIAHEIYRAVSEMAKDAAPLSRAAPGRSARTRDA